MPLVKKRVCLFIRGKRKKTHVVESFAASRGSFPLADGTVAGREVELWKNNFMPRSGASLRSVAYV